MLSMSLVAHWYRIFEYWLFVVVSYRQAQWKKSKQIFKIRHIQINELPRTLKLKLSLVVHTNNMYVGLLLIYKAKVTPLWRHLTLMRPKNKTSALKDGKLWCNYDLRENAENNCKQRHKFTIFLVRTFYF